MSSVRRALVIILLLGVVVGTGAPGAALTTQQQGGDSAGESPSDVPESQVFEVSDDGQIHAWERAAYTLRTVNTDAATAIPAPNVFGERLSASGFSPDDDGVDTVRLNQYFDERLEPNPVGVHDSGEPVTVSFRAGQATTGSSFEELNGQGNVEIVAARLTPQDGASLPSTSEAFDLLSDVDSANANASFRVLENDGTLDSAGHINETASFRPGQYVVFAAVHEDGRDGFETDDEGNVSVDGEVTVVGMDKLAVQQGRTSVTTPEDPEPGDSLTFGVDTTDAFAADRDGEITHAVAVYNASTFENARFDLVVNESALGPDFELTEQSELEHSIGSVNGVADVEDGVALNGNDLSDGLVRRPVAASAIVDFFADDAGVGDPNVNPIRTGGASPEAYEQIDASVTARAGGDRTTDIDVDTFGNFSEGTYRYVVVSALDSNESRTSTVTGTIELAARSSGDGDADGGGDGNDGGGDDSDGSGGGNDGGGGGDAGGGGGNDGGGGGDAGGGGGNDGGGGGGADGDGGDPPATTGPIVTTPSQSLDGDLVSAVPSVAADQRIVVTLPETADSGAVTNVERVNVTSTDTTSDVRISVTPAEQPTDGTPTNERASSTLGYVNVDLDNLPRPDSADGTFTFTVSEQRLAELGVSPDNVVMYRYHDGSWTPIETTHLGGDDYQATTPGFSWFAIGTANASISVRNVTLSSPSADAGETVTVSATVENTGGVAGNATLDITANGEQIDSRTVSVDAGTTTVETFSLARDQPGNYTLGVNGVAAGSLTVSQTPSQPATATRSPSPAGGPAEAGAQSADGVEPGGIQPLTIVIVAAVLTLLGAAAYSLREQSRR